MAKKLSEEEILANLTRPRVGAIDQNDSSSDPLGQCQLTVNIDQLVPYDGNPRKSINPKYEEIKESIRHQGLRDKFTLTRRSPDDKAFMIRDGGNTRLQVLCELWEETHDERFYMLEDLDFYPWKSEIDTLAGHMSENENRGNMLFIERAHAAARFREMFEEEAGKKLNNQELKERISQSGWTVDITALGYYFFTIEYLEGHLSDMFWQHGAGERSVREIRKIHRRYRKLCIDRGLSNEEYSFTLSASLTPIDEPSFNKTAATQFIDALDENIGSVLGIDPNTVNHLAMGYQLGAQATGKQPEPPATNTPPIDEAPAKGPADTGSEPSVKHNDHVPRETNTLTPKTTQPEHNPLDQPPPKEPPTPISPETAEERFKGLQQKNRKLAKQVVSRLKISSDVMEIDEGMGYAMTELRTPLLFENGLNPNLCKDYLILHCFTQLTAMSLALQDIGATCQNGQLLDPRYQPSQTLANALDEGLAARDVYQAAEYMTLRQRALARAGVPVDDIYTTVTEEFLEPLEANFFSIIECWRLMGWELDLANTNT